MGREKQAGREAGMCTFSQLEEKWEENEMTPSSPYVPSSSEYRFMEFGIVEY